MVLEMEKQIAREILGSSRGKHWFVRTRSIAAWYDDDGSRRSGRNRRKVKVKKKKLVIARETRAV